MSLIKWERLINCDCMLERLHNPERGLSHWSVGINWPADRWDPMSNAPSTGYPILSVRVRNSKGKVYEPAHYACGGGEEQPPFDGWFVPYRSDLSGGFYEIEAYEWQPLIVTKNTEEQQNNV